MKHKNPIFLSVAIKIAFCLAMPTMPYAIVDAGSSTISYQGRLIESNEPANGAYDLRFILYDAEAGGSQVGALLTRSGMSVEGGMFTVSLDFGGGVFDGSLRWLQIDVAPAGSGNYSTLSPRQPWTPAPMAHFAMTPSGPQGPAGETGPAGPEGPTGPQGPEGASPFELVDDNALFLSGRVGIGTSSPGSLYTSRAPLPAQPSFWKMQQM